MTTAWTPQSWAEELLDDVNLNAPSAPAVPVDANTVSDIEHWMPAEEPTSDWYDRDNPLNASLGTSSTDGTGSYPDLATAADYTAQMIDQGNMAGIRSALASDDTPAQFSPAVAAAPWASGHYGGSPGAIAATSPGGGSAPSSAGYVGQVPAVSASELDALNASGATATEASLNDNPFELFGIPQTLFGSAASDLWNEIAPTIAKGLLIVTGLGIMVLGLSKLADPGDKMRSIGPELAEAAGAAAA